ncbi:Hypothetical protein PACV_359 [Pacmanvirus A23]|uniref:Hypothetical protein n=1 Tax=Pacmanvirus A23 TaxID=1932881 RepID=UPI000A0940C2|nr:Hypothetical protein B9W72_gp355 [Pacmanvirus A23]SIP86072.1 Hypothetical protein PACV_359 [Pacmanvirus A23]
MCILLIIVIIVLLIILYNHQSEGYLPCSSCDIKKSAHTVQINPFVWPYSATQCEKDIYLNSNVFPDQPGVGTNPSTPDHALQTN